MSEAVLSETAAGAGDDVGATGAKAVRWCALGLVFLFPLVSIFQLRDSDAPWRRAATRARQTIVTLVSADDSPAACGLVVSSRPLRVVMAGVGAEAGLRSLFAGDWVHWSPVYADPNGDFTILQAAYELDSEVAKASFHFDEEVRGHEGVQAALVGPSELTDAPIWVGVLSGGVASGRTLYQASLLRAVSAAGPVFTTDAHAEVTLDIDNRLMGAPFVDSDGHVVALFVGRAAGVIVGVPIENVCGALAMLHLRATN